MVGGGLSELAPGLWRWERRHPEWHPGEFGATVGCYLAVEEGGCSLLVDPLVDGPEDPVLDDLDPLVTGEVSILITIPYHARSAELLAERYRDRGALIRGHELVAKRLSDRARFEAVVPGDAVGSATFHGIGKPRRAEMPLWLAEHRAVVFGDSVVEVDGALRVWEAPLSSERRSRWYHERLLPTLRELADLGPERILVTHGTPVLSGGAEALAQALSADPWYGAR